MLIGSGEHLNVVGIILNTETDVKYVNFTQVSEHVVLVKLESSPLKTYSIQVFGVYT